MAESVAPLHDSELCEVVEVLTEDRLVLARWALPYSSDWPTRVEDVPLEGVYFIRIRVAERATGLTVPRETP